jgi:hypothetical protein
VQRVQALERAQARLDGPLTFLSDQEGANATASNRTTIGRPWELWKKKVMG